MRCGLLVRITVATFLALGVVATGALASAQSSTHRVPQDIDATGERDVTDELTAFLESVPDGSVIELRSDARYRVDGSLVLEDRHDLTIEGNGATIFAVARGDRQRSQWVLDAGSNLTFRELTVRGANLLGGTQPEAYVAELEAQHGFQVEGTRGLELDRVTVEDVYGDFVYLSRDADREWSRDVWIHDSTFARNGRQGIAVVAGRDIVIERNRITDTRRATFDLEPNTPAGWGAQNVHVLDNDIGPGRLLFVASHGNGPVDDIVISGNRLHGRALSIDVRPPSDQRRANWVITDNDSDITVRNPRLMRYFRIDGLQVRGNHQEVTDVEDATIELWEVCGDEIADNALGEAAWVEHHGEPCSAELRVPEPPVIPAREAALRAGRAEATTPTTAAERDEPAGPASRSGRIDPGALDSGTDWSAIWWWVLGAVAVLGGLGGLIALAVARRRRSGVVGGAKMVDADSPDAAEPEDARG